MLCRRLIFVLLVGLLLVLTGCISTDAEESTIYCDSFRVTGITSEKVEDVDATYDSDGDGEYDSFEVWAIVTRVETGEILYSAPRTVIPLGQSAQGVGFTSDEFSFPAVPEGTELTINYNVLAFDFGFGDLMSFTGACQLAPVDPTAEPTDEPTDEPSDEPTAEPSVTPAPNTWKPEWWSPGDDRLNPDSHAYAAIYCDAEYQRVIIYGVNSPGAGAASDGSGYFALQVPYADLPPTPTGANALIAEFEDLRFYRNVHGEYVVIAGPDFEGKEYVVLWDGCPMSYVQRFILQGDRLQRTG